MYDLIIIGGGPAAVAAGIYASRKKIKTLLIADFFGGQSVVSAQIDNFIGFQSLSGIDLKNKLEEHLRAQNEIEIKDGYFATKIEKHDNGFQTFVDGENFLTKTILIATGSRPRKLRVTNEEKFEGKGVFYCSTCDAPLAKNKIAAVVGDGNSALNAVFDLAPYATKIFLLAQGETFKADPATLEKVKKIEKVEVINFASTQEILGDAFVSGLKYQDSRSGEIKTLPLGGVFVEIGYEPNNDLVKDLVKLTSRGKIIIDAATQKTSLPGIWAAGDVTDVLYNQINISIGDGVRAILNIYDYLKINR